MTEIMEMKAEDRIDILKYIKNTINTATLKASVQVNHDKDSALKILKQGKDIVEGFNTGRIVNSHTMEYILNRFIILEWEIEKETINRELWVNIVRSMIAIINADILLAENLYAINFGYDMMGN